MRAKNPFLRNELTLINVLIKPKSTYTKPSTLN